MQDAGDLIVVMDFGAQYAQLIARRVREMNVYCEIWPYGASPERLLEKRARGVIFSGGPSSVYEEGAPRVDARIFQLGIPVLGICYGMQLMSYELGGDVRRAEKREFGKAMLDVVQPEPLLAGMAPRTQVWMSHGDSVLAAPPGFQVLGATDNTPTAAVGDPQRKLYGVQFHPEVVHTPEGRKLLANFLFKVCGCQADWNMGSFIERAVQRVREQVGSGKVLCALSGGVDSSVAAALVHRAVGDQLTCVFVDHGLLRKGEAEQVVQTFGQRFHMKLVHVDAAKRFLSRLEGCIEPELKRKAIGTEFIRVFEQEARRLKDIRFLVQGTIYPDVIESGAGVAGVSATIKTHHNVGGLPPDMQFELVEPLRDLFKDEVRQVGRELGLPEEIVGRHPFPGPGLAIRIIGEVTEEKLAVLRDADAIYLEEIRKAGLYDHIWQAFAVLTGARSVGVQGDARSYGHTIALRAVTSDDGMTADWFRFPPEVLEAVSTRICNEIRAVNRVVYDITSKPPGTIEWE